MTRILTLTLNPALDMSTETEKVAPDRKLRCAAPRIEPGGGGVNVSRAIARLGGESVPMVAAGGATGEQLLALLRAEGLQPVDMGAPGETRRSLSVFEAATGAQYRFVTPGPDWSEADAAQIAEDVAAVVRPGDILVVSGSAPPGMAAGFVFGLNDRLAPAGVRMILDTSGPGLSAAAARAAQPLHALRMNHEEAGALAGAPLDGVAASAAFAAGLVARGAARTVAVAHGALGAVVATPDGRWHARPPRVAVVSKVGAGDSFVGAFTLALSRGEDAARSCAAGVAAAAAAVTTPDSQLCDPETTARLLTHVVTVAL